MIFLPVVCTLLRVCVLLELGALATSKGLRSVMPVAIDEGERRTPDASLGEACSIQVYRQSPVSRPELRDRKRYYLGPEFPGLTDGCPASSGRQIYGWHSLSSPSTFLTHQGPWLQVWCRQQGSPQDGSRDRTSLVVAVLPPLWHLHLDDFQTDSCSPSLSRHWPRDRPWRGPPFDCPLAVAQSTPYCMLFHFAPLSASTRSLPHHPQVPGWCHTGGMQTPPLYPATHTYTHLIRVTNTHTQQYSTNNSLSIFSGLLPYFISVSSNIHFTGRAHVEFVQVFLYLLFSINGSAAALMPIGH